MTRAGLLAILVIAAPVAGTLASVAINEAQLRDATEWRIPITGYDPRDPLRGRYVAFQYDWTVAGRRTACPSGDCVLCMEDGGRRVRVEPRSAVCPASVDAVASGLFVRYATEGGGTRATAATRIWVSEARAPELERQLQTRPMVAVSRLTRSGRLIATHLEPAP
ncbi:GDYXXLXY domain-containing protein [Sphingomonas lenta]|uniref:GDYXXLXY domain-containing protein n=1 Tax=Sphingomonas lenta TaxID=1141887 RepID=A0A2A2SJR1_9SPHN|nr:GDYXXLXY domain-containing protein [Sphingomonas lenta]PAX09400.1 hypothetical protein CKY28_01195 [Sphingomonas lenta]